MACHGVDAAAAASAMPASADMMVAAERATKTVPAHMPYGVDDLSEVAPSGDKNNLDFVG